MNKKKIKNFIEIEKDILDRLNERQIKAIHHLKTKSKITTKEYARLFKICLITAKDILYLKKDKIISFVNPSKKGYYSFYDTGKKILGEEKLEQSKKNQINNNNEFARIASGTNSVGNEKGYCTRWVDVKDLEESSYIAVPKIKGDYLGLFLESELSSKSDLSSCSISSISLSKNTSTNFCLFNLGSLDQMGDLFSAKDNANRASSFECGEISLALDKNFAYSSLGIGLTTCFTASTNTSNSSPEILEDFNILFFSLNNSEYISDGAISLKALSLNFLTNEKTLLGLKNKTLVSIIKNIYSPCLVATPSFTSSASLSACSSVNLDLDAMDSASFNAISSLISSSKARLIDFSNIFEKSISLEKRETSASHFSGTLTTTSAISTSPKFNNENEYLNVAESGMLENRQTNLNRFSASTSLIIWDKIASIKTLPPQHVYDLSIEGTRSFIANDIVAHNTHLATSSGNVGIRTTALTSLR